MIDGPKLQLPPASRALLDLNVDQQGNVVLQEVAVPWQTLFSALQAIAFGSTRSGLTADRPTKLFQNRWIGMPFFDLTINKAVFLKSTNPDVWVTWPSGGGGSSPVLQVSVTEDLTGGNATGTFSDVVLSTTPATITPLSATSHLLIEVTFVGQISQAPGSNFAGGNYNIFDADNSANVALAAYSLQAQSQNAEAILLTAPIVMRAWVPNTVTSLRSFQLVGGVNDLDVAVILVANALLWSITEVSD